MRPDVTAFFDPATNTVTYLLADPASGAAAVIDPVLDFDARAARISTASADKVLGAARDSGLWVEWVLETHVHADHLSAGDHVRRTTGAKIAIGSGIAEVQAHFGPVFGASDATPAAFDRLLEDGDALTFGGLEVRAIHTPGHTPACVTYVCGDCAFVGDTLFMPDYGTARCDFPGGSARTLHRSIQRILSLPDDTRIFVGHDYLPAGRADYAWQTTVADQRAGNVHVGAGASEQAFVTLRDSRDAGLPTPALLLPALQVNIRAGAMPPPDAEGRVFLRLPVNLA